VRRGVSAVLSSFFLAGSVVVFSASVAFGQAVPAPSATLAPTPAAAPANTPSGPRLQAELLKTIDASMAKVGDEVTLKTIQPLEFDGAKYPVGAIVTGHVTEADSSHLTLMFDHIAVKKNPPVSLGLSLRAVMMPQAPPRSTGDLISPTAAALGNGGAPSGRGDMLRSPQAAVADSAVSVFDGPKRPVTGNGGVIGIPGVQLTVSPDPKAGATFQVDKDHKLKLDKGLQAIFVVSK
jgi:hypothetical protein